MDFTYYLLFYYIVLCCQNSKRIQLGCKEPITLKTYFTLQYELWSLKYTKRIRRIIMDQYKKTDTWFLNATWNSCYQDRDITTEPIFKETSRLLEHIFLLVQNMHSIRLICFYHLSLSHHWFKEGDRLVEYQLSCNYICKGERDFSIIWREALQNLSYPVYV